MKPQPHTACVLQAALPLECDALVSQLHDVSQEIRGGWVFWLGNYQGHPVIVSKTRMGLTNAAAATAIAIERYQPRAIINQGTSGGHHPDLNVFDIVLGGQTTNFGMVKTPFASHGAGSDSLQWREAFDMLPDDEADPEPIRQRFFAGDEELLAAARSVQAAYPHGKVVEGVIGSADCWNNELDRIAFLREHYGTLVEEMEAASVAQVAAQYGVPMAAIRVVSNNITNGGAYDPNTGKACQDFVLQVVAAYMGQTAPSKLLNMGSKLHGLVP